MLICKSSPFKCNISRSLTLDVTMRSMMVEKAARVRVRMMRTFSRTLRLFQYAHRLPG